MTENIPADETLAGLLQPIREDPKGLFRTRNNFVLRIEHLKLFSRTFIGWDPAEYGAPEINPKRPYGNSDVERDIAELVFGRSEDDHDGLGKETVEKARVLHQEMLTALQIVLTNLSFQPGVYRQMTKYDSTSWRLIEVHEPILPETYLRYPYLVKTIEKE